jgi:hypothetical protein
VPRRGRLSRPRLDHRDDADHLGAHNNVAGGQLDRAVRGAERLAVGPARQRVEADVELVHAGRQPDRNVDVQLMHFAAAIAAAVAAVAGLPAA